MHYLSFEDIQDIEPYLEFMRSIEWNAGKFLAKVLASGEYHQKFGTEAEGYFMMDEEQQDTIVGFCNIVEQDFIPVPGVKPWIAMLYIRPEYRGQHLSQKFIEFMEQRIRATGYQEAHILTQHKGLYERYGYELVRELDSTLHGTDYQYRKAL